MSQIWVALVMAIGGKRDAERMWLEVVPCLSNWICRFPNAEEYVEGSKLLLQRFKLTMQSV
jgi:hypothetical protein